MILVFLFNNRHMNNNNPPFCISESLTDYFSFQPLKFLIPVRIIIGQAKVIFIIIWLILTTIKYNEMDRTIIETVIKSVL